MIRFGIAAAALVLAGCTGGGDVTAKLVASCKTDGQGTDQQCQCMAENLVKNAGADTVAKMIAVQEAQERGETGVQPTPEEAMKLIGATMQAASTCGIGMGGL